MKSITFFCDDCGTSLFAAPPFEATVQLIGPNGVEDKVLFELHACSKEHLGKVMSALLKKMQESGVV